MQNKNKALKSYSEEQDIKNIKKMREILASLPPFCRQYFRGIETTTSARTRLGYAYDLRIFFEFLHENNPSLHAVPVTSYKISLLNDICKDDIEEYMEYLSYYEKDGRVYTNDERGKARKLSALRSMFRYFYQSELIEKDVKPYRVTMKLSHMILMPQKEACPTRLTDLPIFSKEGSQLWQLPSVVSR